MTTFSKGFLTNPVQPSTWVELLRWRGAHQPGRRAFRFLPDVETEEAVTFTYSELDRNAMAIAAKLQAMGAAGQRALLLYPPGPDYIAAFFGCLYAGVVAVPAYPPRNSRNLPRIRSIVADAGAVVTMTTTAVLSRVEGMFAQAPDLGLMRWLATDDLPAGLEKEWREPSISGESLAFLQYTSGSTSAPKGVMVSHRNLLHNSELLARGFEYDSSTECVTWLPLYHDMGLIGGVLQPLYGGFPNTLMSPLSFLRRPFGWLKAISDYKATLSGGPDFAYDLCARKVSAEQRESLDLSRWGVAFTGAEPIRSETLERFAAAFASCGFRRRAFFPCYGLAEATLFVSGGPKGAEPVVERVRRAALAKNLISLAATEEGEGAQAVVGCGTVVGAQRVLAVDPESRAECPPAQVGEIWVSSPSVTRGYWNRPAETEETFNARLSTTGEGPFLRTGDLGYLRDGELFVTGRLKDLIIIRGRNLYPQDIELTTERSHAALRPNSGAAFTVEVEGEERLVIVQEVEHRPGFDTAAIAEAVRQAVAEEYEVQAHAVVLIKPKSLLKTSSGKIQRRACRAKYLDGALEVIAAAAAPDARPAPAESLSRDVLLAAAPELRHGLLEGHLRARVARGLGLEASRLDWGQPLSSLGLDSLLAVELQGEVESALGVVLPMASFMQSPSTAELTARLLELLSESSPATLASLAEGYGRSRGGVHPLTSGQKGLWFLHSLTPNTAAYNIARAVRVRSALDVPALRGAFQSLVERHDALRATFSAPDGEPVQRVAETAEVCFVEEDAAGWGEAAIAAHLSEAASRPFDLEHGPLLRVHLLRLSGGGHVLLMVVHHIVVDFWSLALMLGELGELYSAGRRGAKAELSAPPLEYAAYARWQTERLSSPEVGRHRDYWLEQLKGELPVLNLPADRPRPAVQTYGGASHSFRIGAEPTRSLKRLGGAQGATLYMVLLAAYHVLLQRYTGQDEIIVGSPTTGRVRNELTSLVGYFVNAVALRADLAADPRFDELLSGVRRTVLEAFEHQEYPFAELVERLQPERDPSRSPVFQTMFILQKAPFLNERGLTDFALGEAGARMDIGGMDWESVALEQKVAQFDLTLTVAELGEELAVSLEYNTDLFDEETAGRMARHYGRVLEAVATDPRRRVSEIELLGAEERHQLLVACNQTHSDYAHDLLVHSMVEARAADAPDDVAVVGDGEQLSYAELNGRANQLARHLRALGVGPDSLVGVMMERSPGMVVALLGVLKAGGAYVPLDPSYPHERVSFMLEDSRVRVLLTERHLAGELPGASARVVALDSEWQDISRQSAEDLDNVAAPENLAYVIYTSGSTGRPKGVMISHRALANFLRSMALRPGLSGRDTLLAVTSLSFDIAGLELFLPLSVGGRVALASRAEAADGAALLRRLANSRATVMQATPATWRLLLDAGWGGDARLTALCGGEALPPALADGLAGRARALWNMYGPTETTIWSAAGEVRPGAEVTLGGGVANTRLYVLDAGLRPAPVGVAGELYIGGDGLARGYLRRPALTAEKFVPDPHAPEAGARMYRTGDLVRRLADGGLRFLGRIDHQVKVRGYRIELGEIETALAAHASVGECVVVAREDDRGDKRLVAYLVTPGAQAVTAGELREHLRSRLPEYMVPSAFVPLAELPLTPNGKVDRKALPALDLSGERGRQTSRQPQTPAEEVLAGLWAEVLQVKEVGVDENFFELGGHSLLATQLMSRVREAFSVEVALRRLFEGPTVAELAAHVESLLRGDGAAPAPPMARAEGGAQLPVSFAQQRLWFIDQLEPGNPFYNIPVAVRLGGALDADALRRALSEVVRRHEVLRTHFTEVEGEPVQVVSPAAALELPVTDLGGMSEQEREAEARRLTALEGLTPFDLGAAPLIRARLLRLSEEEHVALLTMHHIASDGWSIGVLIKEVAALYEAYTRGLGSPLPELELQYADYAAWQRGWLQGEALEQQLSYWRKQLGGRLPVLELPTDRPRPARQTYNGAQHSFVVPADLTESIKELSRREGVTPFMTLLAAFQVLLSRYTGQEDVVVGTPIAGRNRRETESLIGFFVNMLALRTDVGGDPSFRELLGRVREVTLSAYAHQDVPFEKLVEELQPERSLSHTPLFQVMLVLQNIPNQILELPGLSLSKAESESDTAKFDLTLEMTEAPEGIHCRLVYNSDLFTQMTAGQMMQHFRSLLRSVVAAPEQRVSGLALLGQAEREQLLTEWNQTRGVDQRDRSLHQLIEEQAALTPEAVAVIFDDEGLSYAELNGRANQLARHLRSLGVGPDSLVGVMMERSPGMVVALLGVLKAGGAYVPLDPSYPRERVSFMLEDSRVRVLLTERHLAQSLPPVSGQVVALDSEWQDISRHGAEDLDNVAAPENLAYVIYTSGSTGRPKGVAIEHHSAVTLLRWARTVFPAEALSGVLASTSICFDLSVFELFLPLACGGRVILVRNALELPALGEAAGVTLLNTVPSAAAELVRGGGIPRSVRTVNLAGEPLPRKLAEQLYELGWVEGVYNLYGPSEDTTYSTCELVGRGEAGAPTIGRPIAGTQVYVLDRRLEPVPVGVVGEVYIGGDGLARGYLRRPALTAEKFVPDPFSAAPGARAYRTGDLARYLADGRIDFLGRIDHQVKIRGFRIELGEIETALAAHPSVGECVVVAREDDRGDKRLVAYLVTPEAQAVTAGELREHLRSRLPEYMVPSAFVPLAELPLTPNGKVDRKALPAPEADERQRSAEVTRARTPAEEVLAGIFAEVLRVKEVGVDESFFDLGGHSLLATQLMSRVRGAFSVEVALRRLFEEPTVAGLAAHVEGLLGSGEAMPAPPLAKVARAGRLPLSFAQQRLWFIDQLEPANPFYNIPVAVRLSGHLNVEALGRTLSEVVRRHEVLRTHFTEVEGEPVQVVTAAAPLGLPLTDLSGMQEEEREAEARRLTALEGLTPFDLGRGPLIRARLLRLYDEEHVALLTMHHIVGDGWSIGVLIKEVAALYAAYARGEASPLPELKLQYADYAAWQRGWLEGGALEQQLSYWRKQLGGKLPVLELPTDRPRPAVQTFRGRSISFAMHAEAAAGVRELSRRESVTPFMTLLAAFQVLLHRYAGQDDLVVGTPIAGRNREEIEPLVGFFVNTLALRTDLTGGPSFRELVGRVREVTLSAYAHQDVPFEKLVEELQPERSLSHTPLFQVMFALQNTPAERLELPQLAMSNVSGEDETAKFDLTLTVVESGGGLRVSWNYNTDLFDEATVRRMASHYERIVAAAAAEPESRVSEIELLGAEERELLLVACNQTHSDYAHDLLVHSMVEARAADTPDDVAVVGDGEQLSYAELNGRANQLARHLRALGVGPDSLVGVMMERSPGMVVALLGVLKAGGAYVPLDPSYPHERVSFMLEDSRVRVLLTERHLAQSLPPVSGQVVALDSEWETISRYDAADLQNVAAPENLAYVIYTSGSTGRPKGVQVTHRALANFLTSMARRPGLRGDDTLLAVTSLSFDIAGLELFLPLSVGARVALASRAEAADGAALLRRLADSRATVMQATPATWRLLLDAGWGGDARLTALCGGEALPPALADGLAGRARALWNMYGPTETTIWSAAGEVRPGAEVTLGGGVANTRLYVLDAGLRPAPVGVAGELYIGGDGLARGYLRRPALTAEKFVPDPHASEAGARMYRTGDLVRRLADGGLRFLGRIDHQVKVRGYRIELGEIETALSAHASVGECVVVAREDDRGDKRLVAYLVAAPGEEGDVTIWREHLRSRLPEYMVPSAFVTLDSLPLTPNGKVDRKALPAPGEDAGRDEIRQPRTPAEEVLAGIFAEVLRVKEVGVDESFFDLGGHSLLATQLMSRVRGAFSVEVALRRLFEEPTVAGLAAHVEGLLGSGEAMPAPPLAKVARAGRLPLSFAQQRLWFIDRLEPANPFYNIPVGVRLSGALDVDALGRTLTEVVRRHEVLRTHFAEVEGEPVQVISPAAPLELPLTDLSGMQEEERETEARRLSAEEAHTPFDLGRGPLMRARLLRLSEYEHVVLLTMHHIVADGWSFGVLIKELAALYAAYARGEESPLPELELQYADYAAWQRGWLQGDALEVQVGYWRKQLGGKLPVLELPTDRPRPAVQTFRGSQTTFTLRNDVAEGVRELSRREGVTLFMTLLAAFQVLLSRYTNQEDIVVGSAIAGRNRKEIEPLIGFFINTLVLRTDVGGNPRFRELLRRVREVTLSAYAHQDVPFEKLVEELQPERSLSHTPLFQVAFGVQNVPAETLELPGLRLSPVGGGNEVGRFDLTVWVAETAAGTQVRWSYNTDLFDAKRVERMQRHFEQLLASATAEPEARLSALDMLTTAEKAQKLSEQDEQEEASLRKLMGARRKSFRRVRETEAETDDNSTPGDVPSPQRPHGVDATI